MRLLSTAALLTSIAFLSACGSDPTGPATVFAVAGGDGQTAFAGTPVPTAIVIAGANGQATFSIKSGGGSLSNTVGQVNSDGTITAPIWTLGKSDVPQELLVTSGSQTIVVSATIKTSYKLEVRFFGRTLSPSQSALFTNAAARVRGLIVGAVPPVNVTGAGISPDSCGSKGVGVLSETINGLIIYASIDSIDGPKQILAQSGPCYIRSATDFRTLVGIMKFDSADINSLAGTGNLQEVITHEMMHVVGFGSFWPKKDKNLLINDSTPAVAYIGAGGIAGCKTFAPVTCANSVPVEGTRGGAGTLYSHWDETTFNNELMTGFINSGRNPLSVMSVRSFEDLGYVTNAAAADPYIPPSTTNFRANVVAASAALGTDAWEKPLAHGPRPFRIPGSNR